MEKPKTLGIKEIITDDDHHEKVIFPNLKKLELKHLPKLTSFAVGINSVEFPSLLKLVIIGCYNLRRFISTNSYEDNTQPLFDEKVNFPSLEELKVGYCDSMEVVVGRDESDLMEVVVGGDEGKLIEMIFPKLHYLELSYLPKLTSFVVGNNSVKFPSLVGFPSLEVFSLRDMDNLGQIWQTSDSLSKLKELKISGCNELISIFQPMIALPNLMTLDVYHCVGLRSLMTLSTAESMVNLTEMNILYCEKLEGIIEERLEEEKVKEDRMVFCQLQFLQLVHLPSLTCFCLGKLYTLEFLSLEGVYVSRCPNMKTFSQGELRTPKLQEVTWPGEYCWEGNLNSTIQKMFKEMNTPS